MDPLDVKQTKSSPALWYDPARRLLGIIGDSYPENSFEFYAPLFAWLQANLAGLPSLRLEINVGYMNSSSTKCMLDLLDLLGAAHAGGQAIEVDWYCERDNPRARDLAEEFREECRFPFRVTVTEG